MVDDQNIIHNLYTCIRIVDETGCNIISNQ